MILITGSSGFLGKSILNFFLHKIYQYFDVSEIELVIDAAGKAHKIPKTKIEVSQFLK